MSSKQNVKGKASGALGTALTAILEKYGKQTALAFEIGCGVESLGRWIRGDAKPAPKYAHKLCELFPDLRTALEDDGCFENQRRRPRSFNRPLSMTVRARRRRGELGAEYKAERAREKKKARRLVLLKRRHQILLRKKAGKAPRVRAAEPAHRNRVRYTGDFIERMSEITASDVGFTPTYKMEGL